MISSHINNHDVAEDDEDDDNDDDNPNNPRNQGEADENGKLLSPAALQDKALNRFRCPACQTVFCKACGLEGYHLGYTCDEYATYQASRKCRYCSCVLSVALNNIAPLPRRYLKYRLENEKKSNKSNNPNNPLKSILESDVCTDPECTYR